MSILTTSEEQGTDVSPITPLSFGEESRSSPARHASTTQSIDHSRSREPHLMSGGATVGRRTDFASKVDHLDTPPAYYAGETPKSSQHVTTDIKPVLTSGNGRLEQDATVHSSSRRAAHSHKRSASATGLGRVSAEAATITVRLHYDNSRLMLKMSHATSRSEFIEKVRQKIRLCGATPIHSIPYERLDRSQFAPEERVSYLNEANVFAPLDSDADFAAAWKSLRCQRRDPADNEVLILAVGPTVHLGYSTWL